MLNSKLFYYKTDCNHQNHRKRVGLLLKTIIEKGYYREFDNIHSSNLVS